VGTSGEMWDQINATRHTDGPGLGAGLGSSGGPVGSGPTIIVCV